MLLTRKWAFSAGRIYATVHFKEVGRLFIYSFKRNSSVPGVRSFSVMLLTLLKALANEDTLFWTHCCRHKCFPVCMPARATFVADTNIVSGKQKMFLILFRNILGPQQMFSSLRSPRNIMDNNVSSFTRSLTYRKIFRVCMKLRRHIISRSFRENLGHKISI